MGYDGRQIGRFLINGESREGLLVYYFMSWIFIRFFLYIYMALVDNNQISIPLFLQI